MIRHINVSHTLSGAHYPTPTCTTHNPLTSTIPLVMIATSSVHIDSIPRHTTLDHPALDSPAFPLHMNNAFANTASVTLLPLTPDVTEVMYAQNLCILASTRPGTVLAALHLSFPISCPVSNPSTAPIDFRLLEFVLEPFVVEFVFLHLLATLQPVHALHPVLRLLSYLERGNLTSGRVREVGQPPARLR